MKKLIMLGALLLPMILLAQDQRSETRAVVSPAQLVREGRELSTQNVNELEDRLASTPDDLSARTRLLGYYFSATGIIGQDNKTCQQAFSILTRRQLVEETKFLRDEDCPSLYSPRWLGDVAESGRQDAPGCVEAMNAIDGKGVRRAAVKFISNRCRDTGAEATRAARRRHILWMIQHHPENDAAMLPEFTIDPTGHRLADADGYEQARKLWMDQADQRNDDVKVLTHAARFFRLNDKALALTFLKQALELEPDNRDTASRLGYTYAITALGITMINNNGLPMSADPAEATGKVAAMAINELRASSNPVVIATAGTILSQYGAMIQAVTEGAINQNALAEEILLRASTLDTNDPGPARFLSQLYKHKLTSLRAAGAGRPEERTMLARKSLEQAKIVVDRTTGDRKSHVRALTTASKAAVDAEAFDQAQRFASDLLTQVADPPNISDGPAFHDGHVVLGHVALNAGDVEQAKAHLLQAGSTPGGGGLTSFGPNMSLAKALAERGEHDTVVAYLELCQSFWPKPRLEQWIQTLRNGEVPNFGANLVY